ncbi:helix-turn-helix domain-containing protein [uncultured Streptococcus sp.]|uniref:helix-turn-helix domain-containing protein n=1 Tax=uncultured Streptococcus sp. TaxID=83427 RepID=UPI0037DC259C
MLAYSQLITHQLAQDFMISEVTLGRHISALTKKLAVFNVSIQNGRLKWPDTLSSLFYMSC